MSIQKIIFFGWWVINYHIWNSSEYEIEQEKYGVDRIDVFAAKFLETSWSLNPCVRYGENETIDCAGDHHQPLLDVVSPHLLYYII